MDNMEIYNAFRITPPEAKKLINGGRLAGMTDINPMYRIRCLTEKFGPCGVGWYYDMVRKWTEQAGEEILCFVDINLYIKVVGEWSKPITGSGGSALLEKEKNGMHANDEGYKMATTDALGVACKQLGLAADVYWERGESKYNASYDTRNEAPQQDATTAKQEKRNVGSAMSRKDAILAVCDRHGMNMNDFEMVLEVLRRDGKVANKKVKDMTVDEVQTLLLQVESTLQAKK